MRKTDHDEAAMGLVSAGGSAAQSKQHHTNLRLAHKNENGRLGLDVIRQTTISTPVTLDGVGLHKGTLVQLVLKPAEADTGVVFRRTDLETDDVEVTDIPARYDTACDTTMCTVIGNAAGTTVATIEHIMAAVCALGIDNLLIEIDAQEVPVMDGSSDAFVAMLDRAGRSVLPAPRRFIRLLEPVSIEDGLKTATLEPYEDGFRVEFSIDFDNAVIGAQELSVDVSPESFRGDLSNARTFGFLKDYEMLRSLGLAQGATLDNAIVLDGDKIMNEDGLRAPDEFVRHKVLDAIGDLSLAGAPILGCYRASRAGHAFNNQMLHALFANPQAWEVVTMRHKQEAPVLPQRAMPSVAPIAVSAD